MAFVSKYDESILNDEEENFEVGENVGDELFLDILQQKTYLYDKTDKNYHERVMILNAWSDVSNIMGEDVKDCQRRWEKLRNHYNREKIARQNESKSGSGLSKRKPWQLFERISSMFNKFAVKRSTISNINPSSDTYREAEAINLRPSNCTSGNKVRTKPKKDTYGISANISNLNSVIMSMTDLVQNKAASNQSCTNSNSIFGDLVASELCHFDDVDPEEAIIKYKEIMSASNHDQSERSTTPERAHYDSGVSIDLPDFLMVIDNDEEVHAPNNAFTNEVLSSNTTTDSLKDKNSSQCTQKRITQSFTPTLNDCNKISECSTAKENEKPYSLYDDENDFDFASDSVSSFTSSSFNNSRNETNHVTKFSSKLDSCEIQRQALINLTNTANKVINTIPNTVKERANKEKYKILGQLVNSHLQSVTDESLKMEIKSKITRILYK